MRVLLFLFFAGLAYGQTFNEVKLTNALKTKCNTNAQNENAFEEAKQGFVDYQECISSKFKKEPPNPLEDHEGFCNFLRSSGFYGCVENLTRGIAPCLDDSEKYLPHLILHAVNSTYDELCGANGVANSKLIFNKMTSRESCSGSSSIAWSEWECLNELEVLQNLDTGIINFNKQLVCHDLDKLQSCIKSVIKRVCPNSDEDLQFMDLIFTPFTEECNDLVQA